MAALYMDEAANGLAPDRAILKAAERRNSGETPTGSLAAAATARHTVTGSPQPAQPQKQTVGAPVSTP